VAPAPVSIEAAPPPVSIEAAPAPVSIEAPPAPVSIDAAPPPVSIETAPAPVSIEAAPAPISVAPVVLAAVEEPVLSTAVTPAEVAAVVEPQPAATVHPISRPTLKLQPPQPPPPAAAASTEASLVELLRTAVARRASTLYAVAGSRPMIRVDAEIEQLGTEPVVTNAEVERFALEFAPREQVADAPTEWTCAVPGIGRVRSVTFRDHSGAGLILHLPPPNVGTGEALELDSHIQALCDQPDGLIVVAGPRASGKSTMLSAFVDFINRTRNEHVITIESKIRIVHDMRRSFISQREVHGDGEAFAIAARAALREGPDVLVIADLRAPEAIGVALDAARAGRLVFGAIAAPSASAAVERLIDAFADHRRPQVRALLAGALRAVVAQVLVERPGGGRVGARELLLNSPAVGKLVVDGMSAQLPVAIEAGRRLGMNTMIDSLGALVRTGVVEAAEACRQAPDRAALIVALRRDGIDVSSLERRA
jgi:twitching motility protein PilT